MLRSIATLVVIERLARLGFASIGVVYMIIGVLAAAAGLGEGGETTSQERSGTSSISRSASLCSR